MPLLPKNFIPRLIRFITNRPGETTLDVYIKDFAIGRGKPCFFTAEIGINHNGSLEIAKKLIDAAVEIGAQAVKFQKRTILVFYSNEELERPVVVDRAVLENAIQRGVLPAESVKRLQDSDFKSTTRGDYIWAREFTEPEYQEIFTYAEGKGLLVFASPWDSESIDFLEKFDPPCYKVASAMLTNTEILKKLREIKKPIIVSTGMSTMDEVKDAVRILSGVPIILLHTVSTYPAKENEINLRAIIKLRNKFPTIPIGYSGHEKGIAISLAAATLGAHVIERHITLDKKMFGTDQSASLEPQEFAQLISEVREMEQAFGDGVKRVLPSEIPAMNKLRRKKDF